MSHFTTIESKIFNSVLLKETLKELGYTILEEKLLNGYGGQIYNVDFQAKKDNYTIGFLKQPNKAYNITGDFFFIRDSKNVINKIKQEYSKKVVIKSLKHSGYNISDINNKNDKSIQIVMVKR